MTQIYTLPLADPQATIEIVGVKGASLSRLSNAGLPVPGGFHITTAAYREVVAENGLQPRIMAALEQARTRSPAALKRAAETIGRWFEHAVLPPVIADAIPQAYRTLDPAGVMFTADPVNVQRDEVVINAAWGLGEAIVGGLVTPDTLTLEKASGRVLSRETSDKHLMTVRVESGTVEQPVPEARRRAPMLDDGQASIS